ncbi:hypothetical protein HZY62_10710 [Maribacter polysiphoniae]|uniref:Lipocalin-like protein n=1 Tax=Maribacter polysiphoniae TaxID=429344 RepID=A0A316E2V2_9FLAO|nr:hypothetical protein [Maribacter polysiphoniae]MBD1261060.1 hypothetical protein [Maribacter polysiphoniae]PWK23699.1 hypothetical protein LX92_02266 [Maribacter polysiphoniae]
MKKSIYLVLLLSVFVTIVAFTSDKPETYHSIEGTWELENFYNFDGGNITDTLPTSEGYRQVKMYYNGKVMWSRTTQKYIKDADGNNVKGRFGYGTYKITMNELIENIEYGDIGMMTELDTLRNFKFELWLGEDRYSQITLDEEGNRTFSENYKRID